MSFDVAAFRAGFPSLASGIAHFDNPGGTQTPAVVGEAIARTLTGPLSQRGSATISQRNAEEAVAGFRSAVADLMIDTVEAYAPGFRASVLGRQVLSPRDLERIFGLPNGDIFHGALSPDQLFSARPIWGHADYRMPLSGLYLCGSGAHPGGGVTGAPGHNAAAAVIADLRAPS